MFSINGQALEAEGWMTHLHNFSDLTTNFFPPLILMAEVYVTWKGTEVTNPLLVFHDEIQVINNTYARETGSLNASGEPLFCASKSNAGVAWHFTDGTQVPDSPATVFQQERNTLNFSQAWLSRGIAMYDISDRSNGLWMCRVNESADGEMLIGIYYRDNR